MIARRDLIMGGAAIAAASIGYGLRPRRQLKLLGDRKLANIIPPTVGPWVSQTDDNLVRPETEGRLAAMLYSEIVSRLYENADTGDTIMMLIAYGDVQSDLLQLHRPEVCYPAVGFRLAMSAPATIQVGSGGIPSRRVVAARADRQENIVYWTRLGEHLPRSGGEQREARLLTAMQGYVADGGLFRLSMLGESQRSFKVLETFAAQMIEAVPTAGRPALIGTNLARHVA